LHKAAVAAGPDGLRHDSLTQRVFEALALEPAAYASNPEAKFQAKVETDKAFRDVLGYRLYRDLKRGWRVTSPNLEQCGLLEIRYRALEAIAAASSLWQAPHPLLLAAPIEARVRLLRVLVDSTRRGLALDFDVLRRATLEQLDP